MTDATLRQALAFATSRLAGPALPARPEDPRHRARLPRRHHRPAQITDWFGRHPDWNLAIATGAPGPDVLDVDEHGPAGNGYPAFRRLRAAGLLDGAGIYVRTPSGGLHVYFAGSAPAQRPPARPPPGLPVAGGYVLTPPSQIDGQPYQLIEPPGGRGGLDWAAVTRLLQPQHQPSRQQPRQPAGRQPRPRPAWPAGSPASPKATATPACSGPPTAPWTLTRPPT